MIKSMLLLGIVLDQTTHDVWIHVTYTGPALVWRVRIDDQEKRVAGVTDTWFRFKADNNSRIFSAELTNEEL